MRNAHFVSLRFYRAYYAVSGQLGKLDFPSSQSSLHTCSNTYLSWPSLPQPLTLNTPSHCLSISCIACLKTLPPFSSSERCFDSKLEVFKYEFAKVIRNKWRSLLLLPNSAGSPEREGVPACLSVPNTIPECHCSRDNPGGERVDAYGERAAVVPEK